MQLAKSTGAPELSGYDDNTGASCPDDRLSRHALDVGLGRSDTGEPVPWLLITEPGRGAPEIRRLQ